MSLRVIAGKARGRKLKSVEGDTTRPITDRAKESLFNILGGDVIDSHWWDLFGGTGAVGIEALSRGASFVRFTDLNREPIETINHNLKHCNFESQSEVRRADAFTYLSAEADRKFEYIYIAPPQYQGLWLKALSAIDANPAWLEPGGQVVVQIFPKEDDPDLPLLHLRRYDERQYGSTLLCFYEASGRQEL